MSDLSYDTLTLIHQWRERYSTRRSVNREMLDQAELLVRDAIAREVAQTRHEAKTEREYDLERRERAVERAEARPKYTEDSLRRRIAELEAKLAAMSPRMTLMREERETIEDGTVVRILAPTVPAYGDKSQPRPWMLGELEDVIHRLRMGGGDDGTEIRFKLDAVEACIPFAEFALVPAKPPRPEPGPSPVHTSRALDLDWRLAAGLMVLIIAAVLGLVVLR